MIIAFQIIYILWLISSLDVHVVLSVEHDGHQSRIERQTVRPHKRPGIVSAQTYRAVGTPYPCHATEAKLCERLEFLGISHAGQVSALGDALLFGLFPFLAVLRIQPKPSRAIAV